MDEHLHLGMPRPSLSPRFQLHETVSFRIWKSSNPAKRCTGLGNAGCVGLKHP